VGFEVHRIRVAPAGEYRGSILPEREILATIREWGEFGWSYSLNDYKGALKRFHSILPAAEVEGAGLQVGSVAIGEFFHITEERSRE
jgi:hypothetical protein